VAALERIGALESVLAAGAVPLDRLTLVNEDVRIDGTLDPAAFPRPGLCVRRFTLDALLVGTAEAAGADVRTGVKVVGLRTEGERIVGVDTEQGPIQARLVIGADGRQSTVAAAVGAREYLVTPGSRMAAWAYFEGVGDREGRLRLGRFGEHGFLAGPTDSDLYMAGVTTGAGFGRDRDAGFSGAIASWPELADLLAGARRVTPIRVMTKWHGYFRQSAGPGWVLVGDAGHFKDFTPAQGIADALRQAERLAEMLPDDLADRSSVDAATQRWWRWRDRDAHPMYWFATDMGVAGPSTLLVTEVLRDVATDSEATLTLLRILNHEVDPGRLLTPRRLVAAAARALRDHPGHRWATIEEIATTAREEIRRASTVRRPPPGMTGGRRTRRARSA
jgi:2-polyprenyl-6-methoxyphenol hydroxylase-like FAD-dependent oxidoreductase